MAFGREWYGYHFPELVKIVNDNATYCRIAQFIGNRRELNEDKLEKLEELTMDGAKAKAILDASRSSMGQYRDSTVGRACAVNAACSGFSPQHPIWSPGHHLGYDP